jgi:DNA-binding CsgD family transcriptional regulator
MRLPLDPSEIKNVFHASQQMLCAGSIEDLRKDALLIFQRLFHSEKGNFFLSNRSRPYASLDLESVSTCGISDKSLRLFRQYYHQLDPFKNALKKQSVIPQVIIFKELVSFEKLVKTEYYNDFLKPQDIHDQLAIYLTSGNHFLGAMALFRSKNSPVFSDDDKAKAKLIAPFLTAALERTLSIKKNKELEQAIHSIAFELPYEGIMVLDQSLTPVYANDIATGIISRLYRSNGAKHAPPSEIPDVLYTPAKELAAQINRSISRELPHIDLQLTLPNSQRKVAAHLRVHTSKKFSPLILICLSFSTQGTSVDGVLKHNGISPRELDIIRLLSEGKKNSEIAEALFISEYTVENHLRSIYRKMNVKNRTALVHKLIKLA